MAYQPKPNYGKNRFSGASSDVPGEHTTSGFLPQVTLPDDKWQTRKVDDTALPTAKGLAPSGKRSGGAPDVPKDLAPGGPLPVRRS